MKKHIKMHEPIVELSITLKGSLTFFSKKCEDVLDETEITGEGISRY